MCYSYKASYEVMSMGPVTSCYKNSLWRLTT